MPRPRHHPRMVGAFLNALGILLGALFGLARSGSLSTGAQKFCQSLLGALTAFCGLQILWLNMGGGFRHAVGQFLLALIALLCGNLIGKVCCLQKISNRIGRRAAGQLVAVQKGIQPETIECFSATTILLCAAPLGLVGAVVDGLCGQFFPLALKAVMDGLAMMSFVKVYRWPVALSALPVYAFLGTITATAHHLALPYLTAPLLQSINIASGLVICAATLVVLELRRVELANFLPALVMAPLLTKYFL